MTIGQGSRYVGANVVTVNATSAAFPHRGNIVTVYTPVVRFTHTGYTRYQTRQGDTYWKLAAQYLTGAKDWWRIADLNPQIFYPDDITPGTIIRMPVR